MEETTSGTAAGTVTGHQRRKIGITLVLGGLALLAVAYIAWFGTVTAPRVYDEVRQEDGSLERNDREGGMVFDCPEFKFLGIRQHYAGRSDSHSHEPACEEPASVRRLAASALTIPGVVFLVVGAILARGQPDQPARSRSGVPEKDTGTSQAVESMAVRWPGGGHESEPPDPDEPSDPDAPSTPASRDR